MHQAFMETKNNPQGKEAEKVQAPPASGGKKATGWIIASIILLVGIGVLAYLQITTKKEMVVMERVLTEEKDSLTKELNAMIYGYDTLKTNNDSLNVQLEREQDKIRQLLAIQASNVEKIQLYKKELSTLRDVMRSYIIQIDSLNTRNKLLVEENLQVKTQLEQAQTEKEELSKIREELSSKVQKASVIKATDITVTPINSRGKERDRINRMEQIVVCFTLRENPIAPAGKRYVYLRLVRPDELVLTLSVDNLFEYQDNIIVYSARREVEYMNQDVEMCIYYPNDGQFIPGEYTATLYADGHMIGSTEFLLK